MSNLMFPRLARNFIKNGYYPTDEPTLERILNALQPMPGCSRLRIGDTCAGEGVAIAEIAHNLGAKLDQLGLKDEIEAYAVEYDIERANHARQLVDHCIQGDLMDMMISQQAFGLLFLNPPYGDLNRDQNGNIGYNGKGKARLEKLFYQRNLPFIQYGGVLVLLMPHYVLDAEFIGWLTRHFTDLTVFRGVETQFKQIVIMGRRIKGNQLDINSAKDIRQRMTAIGLGEVEAEVIPEIWTLDPYYVPQAQGELKHFYRVSIEPKQFAAEIAELGGLWNDFDKHFNAGKVGLRRPARALGQWHLSYALAAGAITGALTSSKTGRSLVVKGDTYKAKAKKSEYTTHDDGSISETIILTDKFVPVIYGWDMTPSSPTFGQILTIN